MTTPQPKRAKIFLESPVFGACAVVYYKKRGSCGPESEKKNMMIASIYEYDTGNGTIWSPNGCGIRHHGKDCPRLSELEVKCERMTPDDFFKAIQNAEWRIAHIYNPDNDPRYDWVKKVTGLKRIR